MPSNTTTVLWNCVIPPQQDACRCFIRSRNAVKFSEVHLTLQHIVLDVPHPLTCLSLWTAQITRRRCELCLPYLPDKAGGLQNTAFRAVLGSKNINSGNAGGPNIRAIKARYPGGPGTVERRSTELQLWSWTFHQLLTHLSYRRRTEIQTLCSLVVFCTSLPYSTDATPTLYPSAVFDSDLSLNRYREFNICLWKIWKSSSALPYFRVHKKTYFLCKCMIMRFYVCKIISAPSSWVAAPGFPEGHQTNRNVLQGYRTLVLSFAVLLSQVCLLLR